MVYATTGSLVMEVVPAMEATLAQSVIKVKVGISLPKNLEMYVLPGEEIFRCRTGEEIVWKCRGKMIL